MTRHSRELMGYAVALFTCYGVFVRVDLWLLSFGRLFVMAGTAVHISSRRHRTTSIAPITIAMLLLLPLLWGCTHTDLEATTTSTVPLDVLLSAPERILIGNREYSLETYLWRDFMPIQDPGGSPLTAVVRLVATDSGPLPPFLDADRLWVIQGSKIWEDELMQEGRPLPAPDQLKRVAREGPKWQPRTRVDVVVRVIDGARRTYLLKAGNQLIERTD